MGAVYEVNVNGNITYFNSLSGLLSANYTSGNVTPIKEISGSLQIPRVLDSTAIHYDTVEAWNSMTTLIAEQGHIYVYADYQTREDEGDTIYIPAIKIGDGVSYLIDMPYLVSGNDETFIDHINNWAIHVSDNDRTSWNNKVSTSVIESEEELIFSI